MKAGGQKKKGSRLELKVARAIRSSGLDDKAMRMPLSGASWSLPSDIYLSKLPLSIECKNQEKLRLWDWWDQCRNQRIGNRIPVLAISSNNRPILMAVDLDDFINLLKMAYGEK
jgi:hypothetical protein